MLGKDCSLMVCAAASAAAVRGKRDKNEERIMKVAITSVRKWMEYGSF